ncbi:MULTISPECIES: YiiX/YebB-like N1pC/P60 family cysteine hydrolase [Providencia]|uniref:YiiX/YebB-like N1pC/P60 family cysteine hydrolase n=1 Tax=Providencia TaxID=586 RepID=UPI00234A9F7D|nr:YiiX/YebB-like N1pC/P60 family cysteine hydrolase [Providencia sp. PROV129]
MSVYLPALPGDLILISTPNKNLNRIAQSVLRLKTALHSHVAISTDQYCAIHAMPKNGVQIESIKSILADVKGDFVVYRNKNIQSNELLEKIRYELLSYSGQHYNFHFLIKQYWHSSFCSELAARAFESLNVKISKNDSKNTIPSDIYEFVQNNDEWVDITEIYKNEYLGKSYLEVYDVAAEFMIRTEHFNQDMSFGQQQLLDRINFITADSDNPTNHKPPRHFWTNDLTKKFSWKLLIKYYMNKMVRRIKSNSKMQPNEKEEP